MLPVASVLRLGEDPEGTLAEIDGTETVGVMPVVGIDTDVDDKLGTDPDGTLTESAVSMLVVGSVTEDPVGRLTDGNVNEPDGVEMPLLILVLGRLTVGSDTEPAVDSPVKLRLMLGIVRELSVGSDSDPKERLVREIVGLLSVNDRLPRVGKLRLGDVRLGIE
jgi:hypothetical protein